ncbi:hypothetical protein [Aneurinibacillus thermoaerophilus]|uniref:hypothetical protein n=1 Tax=Aneurinibacillus thermoaerophilus TaxID=143495 RepID=UPI001587A0D7|nr:hypothetical protein [Aneurinibacillus thermoaerophilus]
MVEKRKGEKKCTIAPIVWSSLLSVHVAMKSFARIAGKQKGMKMRNKKEVQDNAYTK